MKIVGHRGARAREPENTLRAVRAGLACADCIEVDVRMSRDGVPVIIHDATLDRTTSGQGAVSDHSFEEIRRLDAGGGEQVPTLGEVLDLVRGKASLLVELKEGEGIQSIAKELASARAQPVFLVSFLADALARAHQYIPAVPRGLIYSRAGYDPFADARSVGATLLLPRYDRADEPMVRRAHAEGFRVVLWTVNNAADLRAAATIGADAVATDDPCMARTLLGKIESR